MSDARRSRRGLVCVALLAGVCAVYLQVRHHQFVGYLQKGRSWFRYLLVALFLLMGLLSKPMLVTLPFTLLLLDYWPLGRLSPSDSGRPISSAALLRALLEKLPLFALVAAASVVTYLAQVRARASLELVGLDLRLLTDRVFDRSISFGCASSPAPALTQIAVPEGALDGALIAVSDPMELTKS